MVLGGVAASDEQGTPLFGQCTMCALTVSIDNTRYIDRTCEVDIYDYVDETGNVDKCSRTQDKLMTQAQLTTEGADLDSRTSTSQKSEAVPKRARI